MNVSAFSFLKYRADPKAQEDILQSSPTYLFPCHFRLLQTVLCSVSPALDVDDLEFFKRSTLSYPKPFQRCLQLGSGGARL